MTRRFALALLGLVFATLPAAAQTWPTRQVKLVVPFAFPVFWNITRR